MQRVTQGLGVPISADTALCLSCLLGFFSFTAVVASSASSFSPFLFLRQVGEAAQLLQPHPGHLLYLSKVKLSETAW